jgi:succinoglycan biosynthesis protein ExoA
MNTTPPPADRAGPAPPQRWLSILVPCRNERDFIDAFVAGALAQAQALPPPWRLELLVAEGGSDDGTAERLQALAAAEPALRVLPNPGRTVACGLNRALAAARGEVLLRMDVHTRYAPDYAAQCLATLARTGADNVGGPWRAEGQGAWGQAIAAAFQSRTVAGGALSRDLGYEGEVDTVYLGCWPRASFERWGPFDEALVRNQDDEHNLRMRRGGGRIWQSPHIRSVYQARGAPAQLVRQWLQYGYWRPFVMKKHGQAGAWRHHITGALVLAAVPALLGAALGQPGPLLLGAGGYLAVVLGLSLWVGARAPGLPWAARWRLPLVIAAMQTAYGVGNLLGAWDAWRHGQGRQRFMGLSR